jgi:hypothetical protein
MIGVFALSSMNGHLIIHRKFQSIVRSMYLLVGSVQMFGLVA